MSTDLTTILLIIAGLALALGAGVVDFASTDAESLAVAERLGARPSRRAANSSHCGVDSGESSTGAE